MKTANLNKVASLALLAADTALGKQAAVIRQHNEEKETALKQAASVQESLKAAGFLEDPKEAADISAMLKTHVGTLTLLKNAAEMVLELATRLDSKTAAVAANSIAPVDLPGIPARNIGKAAANGPDTPAAAPGGDYVQQNIRTKRAQSESYLSRMGVKVTS